MDNAKGLVEITSLAKGKAGIASLVCQLETIVDRGFGIQDRNLLSGVHDLSYKPLGKFKGVQCNIVPQGGTFCLGPVFGKN